MVLGAPEDFTGWVGGLARESKKALHMTQAVHEGRFGPLPPNRIAGRCQRLGGSSVPLHGPSTLDPAFAQTVTKSILFVVSNEELFLAQEQCTVCVPSMGAYPHPCVHTVGKPLGRGAGGVAGHPGVGREGRFRALPPPASISPHPASWVVSVFFF